MGHPATVSSLADRCKMLAGLNALEEKLTKK
jgi:hypothetical protein